MEGNGWSRTKCKTVFMTTRTRTVLTSTGVGVKLKCRELQVRAAGLHDVQRHNAILQGA